MRERESGETEGEISIGKNIENKKDKSFIYGCFNTRRPRHISCLARHYFAIARKMLWSCEG